MGHLKRTSLLTDVTSVGDPRHIEMHEELRRALEEGNGFEYWEDYTTTTPSSPDVEFVAYLTKLNKVPTRFLVIDKDAAVDVYKSRVGEKNKMFLKATVANVTITVRIFV